jgi:hypothetical protein
MVMGHSSSSAGTLTVILDEGQGWPALNGDVSFFVAVTSLQKISNSIEAEGVGPGESTDGFEMQLDMSLAMDLGRLRFFF